MDYQILESANLICEYVKWIIIYKYQDDNVLDL